MRAGRESSRDEKPSQSRAVNALPPANYWNRSVGDLAIEAAAPIVAEFEAQAVFAAGTEASLVQRRQADFRGDRRGQTRN